MPRYIDIDALKKDIRENYVVYGYADFISDFFRCLDEQSTVDAVEVVRCKDCKYYLNSNEKCGLVDTRLRFYETDKIWTEDCFCAWGERRKDEI